MLLSVHIYHSAFFHRLSQAGIVVGEFHSVFFHHVAGSAHGGTAVVAVFGYFISGSCHYEAGACGDIECVLAVASRANYVYWSVFAQINIDTCAQECFAETYQFFYCYSPHLEDREE